MRKIVEELAQIHEQHKVRHPLSISEDGILEIDASRTKILQAIKDRNIVERLKKLMTKDNSHALESALRVLEDGSINTARLILYTLIVGRFNTNLEVV